MAVLSNFTAKDMDAWTKGQGSPARAQKPAAPASPPPPKVDFDNVAPEPVVESAPDPVVAEAPAEEPEPEPATISGDDEPQLAPPAEGADTESEETPEETSDQPI